MGESLWLDQSQEGDFVFCFAKEKDLWLLAITMINHACVGVCVEEIELKMALAFAIGILFQS